MYLLNNPFVAAQADAFAKRVLAAAPDDEARVVELYRLAFGRRPTAAEAARVSEFVWLADGDELTAWSGVCHAVFAGNEFAYID